jgi:large subunit ribosomal protein L7/L12
MAKLTSDDLLAQFKEMTLVELSDFVKAFETEFDVTAAAPVAAAAAGGAAGGAAAASDQDEFSLILEDDVSFRAQPKVTSATVRGDF